MTRSAARHSAATVLQRTSRLLRLSTSGVPAPLGRGVRLLRLLPPLSTLPPLSALMEERRRWAEAAGAGLGSLPTDARRAYMPGDGVPGRTHCMHVRQGERLRQSEEGRT